MCFTFEVVAPATKLTFLIGRKILIIVGMGMRGHINGPCHTTCLQSSTTQFEFVSACVRCRAIFFLLLRLSEISQF